MDISKLSHGDNPPSEINVVIEVPMNSEPVKYEFNKEVNAMFVDRFMNASMVYPCNYGFIANTLSGDGDPVDVLVYTNHKIIPGAIVKARPIGVLITQDENGNDEKILAVPTVKCDPYFSNIKTYEDLPEIILQRIQHFFEHYKDLEKNKWVKVIGWRGVEEAEKVILASIKNYTDSQE